MAKLLRPLLFLLLGLIAAPWLPLYVERTMIRSQREHGGDSVDFGWTLRTLPGFLEDYAYMRPEQTPLVYLLLNLALAVVYAAALALALELVTRAALTRLRSR